MQEIWEDVKEHQNYRVSNLGRVKSLARYMPLPNGGYYFQPEMLLEWATHSENLLHAFRNGLKKPLYGAKHQNSKLVLNTQTGIFYETATEAWLTTNFKLSTFNAMMCGRNPNRTNFIYV